LATVIISIPCCPLTRVPPTSHSDLADSNLEGTIPASVGAFTSLEFFGVEGNNIGGSLPSSMNQWHNLRELYVGGNKLSVAPLPNLPFAHFYEQTCLLIDHYEYKNDTNAFACPWPVGATTACTRNDNGTNVPLTNADCVMVPTPPPTPTPPGCTGLSVNLALKECNAWRDFFRGAGGPGWTQLGQLCSERDPCACNPEWNPPDDDGGYIDPGSRSVLCNKVGTSIISM
jgi:hypothetical protein